MSGPRWIRRSVVGAIHDRQIARYGRASGLRGVDLLEGALARPMNRFADGETDLGSLAASYAFGVAKAHAVVDGNGRTAFVTSATFLRAKGFQSAFVQR